MNRKSVSPVIAIVLLLMMTVPAAGAGISNVDTAPFRDDTEGKISVSIKNTGEEGGWIETTISCPDPVSDDSESKYVGPGAQKTFSLSLSSASVEKTTTVTCTVEARSDFYSDSQKTNVTVKPSCKDPDNDDICSEYDLCPQEAGPEANDGCPRPQDDDKDGVPNPKDVCPNTPLGAEVDDKGCEITIWDKAKGGLIFVVVMGVIGAVIWYSRRKM